MGSAYLQYVISGLTMGSTYALVALGLTMFFNAAGLVNFAQGQGAMLGAMAAYTVLVKLQWGWGPAVVAVVSVSVVLGWLIFRLIILRPRQTYEHTAVLLTLAFGTVLEGMAMLIWGKDSLSLPQIVEGSPFKVLGATLEPQALAVMVASAVILVLIAVFFRVTYMGKAMLATAENPEAVELIGINSVGVILRAVLLGSILAGIAGFLVAPITLISFQSGTSFLTKGLAAMVIGGMGSTGGSVAGGILIGLTEALAAGTFNTLYKDVVSLIIMMIILFIKPSGLFGGRK